MDIKERAQLVREIRLDLKQSGFDWSEGGHPQGELDRVYGRSFRSRRKTKLTRGNQAMHRRRAANGDHSVDEVFGWDNPRRRKY